MKGKLGFGKLFSYKVLICIILDSIHAYAFCT
jgi:hypothetical protein